MSLDKLALLENYLKYNVNIESRTIYFGQDVEEEGTSDIIKALHFLTNENNNNIDIIINSDGGDEYYMAAIYDVIKTSKSHITIIGCGYVMSAASLIMQAADWRVMLPHATMMIHYGTSDFNGHSLNHARTAKEFDRINKWMEDVYLEKIKEKKPKFTRQQIKALLQFDTYLPAKETVEMGLADEVMGE